jgi:catechol 2,3-dioxygenase-like lactoylglutathione lyase family enzyme
MEVTSVTVGITVRDVVAAREWYEALLGRDGPDVEDDDVGVVEYDVAGCWLQLNQGVPVAQDGVVRFGVPDVRAEHGRLTRLGIEVGPVEVVPGLVDYCDLADPDGNRLSIYTVTEQAGGEPDTSA